MHPHMISRRCWSCCCTVQKKLKKIKPITILKQTCCCICDTGSVGAAEAAARGAACAVGQLSHGQVFLWSQVSFTRVVGLFYNCDRALLLLYWVSFTSAISSCGRWWVISRSRARSCICTSTCISFVSYARARRLSTYRRGCMQIVPSYRKGCMQIVPSYRKNSMHIVPFYRKGCAILQERLYAYCAIL